MSLSTITPVARLELFLQDIADGTNTSTPVSRPEEFLRRIAETNGDQDAALAHIAAQIPVDPTSEDVGKVMTVIADTSGEEPVYKWSAESAGLDDFKCYYKNYCKTTTPFSYVTTGTVGEDFASKIRGELLNASNSEERGQIVYDHFDITIAGMRFLPNGINSISSNKLKLETDPFLTYVKISDTWTAVMVKGALYLDLTENSVTLCETPTFTFWDMAGNHISSSVTDSQNVGYHYIIR